MKDLNGKVAVVTGAASGIGRAMAERFAQASMKLALVDIEEEPLELAAEELRKHGVEVLTSVTDVSKADAMDALASRVLDELGGVHVVCNNAGVGSGGLMWELTSADWEFSLRPNLWGVIHGVRVFAKHLVAQNEGHIVNTASMAGLISTPGMGPYNVTKHGVVTLSETLWADLRSVGSQVGVSVLCPGFVQTRIWESDRNRPEELQNPDGSASDALQAEGKALLKAVIAQGLPADRIAAQVHDAIVEERFYILTHKSTAPEVERRMRSILDGGDPPLPEGGPLVFSR